MCSCPTNTLGEPMHLAGCRFGQPARNFTPRVEFHPTQSESERRVDALERIAAALERIADQGDSLVRPQAPQYPCCEMP